MCYNVKKEKYAGDCMNGVNKTLYIPLYGKAYVSQKGLFINDKKAEEIWRAEGFELKGKSKSKWLAYYMGIRSSVFDAWLKEKMYEMKDAVVLHIGCGLDSRVLRVGTMEHTWYDVDFPEVIEERKRYFDESENYHMVTGDVREDTWLAKVSGAKQAIGVMEGISMYLKPEELKGLMENLGKYFDQVSCLMDSYTVMAAKMSKHKNPINDVGVTEVYGMDDPKVLEKDGFTFVKEHEMIPKKYIDVLSGMEKTIFSKLYAGGFSKKLYRMYEYRR